MKPSCRTRIAILALLGCGVTLAEEAAPPIGPAETAACKAQLGVFHDAQIRYLTREVEDICHAHPDGYTEGSCGRAQGWLQESIATDDASFWQKSNRGCESEEYPCYGPDWYNEMSGEERRAALERAAAQSVAKLDQEYRDAEKETGIDMRMGKAEKLLMRCIGQAWVDHHAATAADALTSDEAPAAPQPGDVAGERPAAADANSEHQASCAAALASQDAEFDAMNQRAPVPGSDPQASGAKALYQMGMYVTDARLKLLDAHCKGEPQYSSYAPTRVSYQSALDGCKALSSDGGKSCVPLKLW